MISKINFKDVFVNISFIFPQNVVDSFLEYLIFTEQPRSKTSSKGVKRVPGLKHLGTEAGGSLGVQGQPVLQSEF